MSGPVADRDGLDPPRTVDLAATAPFAVGGLQVRPATRQVIAPGGREVIAEPRVLQVLVTLAEAAGAVVSRDALIQRCWDGRIVGEDAINRGIAKTRRLAELTEPAAFVIETIPRVGYRLVAGSGEGSVAAASSGRGVGRRAAIALGAATVAGGLGFTAYRWLGPGAKAAPLVAVLPFDNLSPDPQLGFFADGLSEDILNALVRGGGLRVTASTSSFTFRGAAKAKAAEALKADYLLDGSVLRQGSRMRVIARLTDTSRRQTLWSESYDRDVGQGLQVEDEVAGRVATALRLQLASPGHTARTVDTQAYDLYLKGRAATKIHVLASLTTGHALLEAALARAPDFAPAWFELAKNSWRQGYLTPLPEQLAGFQAARQAAERAIALDPGNGPAYGVLAQTVAPIGHWGEIDRGLSRGLALSPNEPNLLLWRGTFLYKTGRLRAAREVLQRAYALDPLDLAVNHTRWQVLTTAGDWPEAQAQAARLTAIWPDQLAGYWDQFGLYMATGRFAQAGAWLADVARRPRGEPEEFAILTEVAAAGASRATSRIEAAGRGLVELARHGIGYAVNSMLFLGALGLLDQAREIAFALYLQEGALKIDRSVEFRDNGRFPIHGEPDTGPLFSRALTPLRRSGQLDRVFAGIGLTDYWRAAGGPDR